MTIKLPLAGFALAASLLCVTPAAATPLGPSSGFLASYTGPQNGDFDIVSGEAFLRGGNFEFDATFSAPIGTTPGSGVFYVWGIDRGLNLPLFGANRPGVLFDAVVIFSSSQDTGFVLDLISNQLTFLTSAQVSVNVDTLKLFVPGALLPTEGFLPSDYLVNLWTRDGLDPTIFAQIAEFAPSNSDVGVTVPEPVTIALFGAGLAATVALRRRKKSA